MRCRGDQRAAGLLPLLLLPCRRCRLEWRYLPLLLLLLLMVVVLRGLRGERAGR